MTWKKPKALLKQNPDLVFSKRQQRSEALAVGAVNSIPQDLRNCCKAKRKNRASVATKRVSCVCKRATMWPNWLRQHGEAVNDLYWAVDFRGFLDCLASQSALSTGYQAQLFVLKRLCVPAAHNQSGTVVNRKDEYELLEKTIPSEGIPRG